MLANEFAKSTAILGSGDFFSVQEIHRNKQCGMSPTDDSDTFERTDSGNSELSEVHWLTDAELFCNDVLNKQRVNIHA